MSETKGFWSSLPGVLTGVAAIITALTGLYIAIASNQTNGDEGEGQGGGESGGITKPEQPKVPKPELPKPDKRVVPVKPIKSSDLLDCTKFPTVNSVRTLMSWSNHYHEKLLMNPPSEVRESCNKVISYRGMAHCQDPNDIEIQYILNGSLELCKKHGFSWKDVQL